mmetsp:Transcript_25394/g.60426  ORF Transcript_25394/g.60426 Transcript_25394/m.60426 type:complete len:215 (-) Transcript_25394:326-970(-)
MPMSSARLWAARLTLPRRRAPCAVLDAGRVASVASSLAAWGAGPPSLAPSAPPPSASMFALSLIMRTTSWSLNIPDGRCFCCSVSSSSRSAPGSLVVLLARSRTLFETMPTLSLSFARSAPMMREYTCKSLFIFSWSLFFSALVPPISLRSLRFREGRRAFARLLEVALSISRSMTAIICAVDTPPHLRCLGPDARPVPEAWSPAMKPASKRGL